MRDKPVVAIVGAGSGIGAACARLMDQRGWSIIGIDKDITKVREELGHVDASCYLLDITDQQAVEDLANELNEGGKKIDALVLTAAAFQDTLTPEDITADVWRTMIDVNLTGAFWINQAFGLHMCRRGAGAIVNVSSVAGVASTPLHGYAAAKAGLITLSANLAVEWGRSNVRVNCVTPGMTLTPRVAGRLRAGVRYAADPAQFMALDRITQPEEVAECIEFLASSRASAVTGANLVVDCGMSLAGTWALYGGVRPKRNYEI